MLAKIITGLVVLSIMLISLVSCATLMLKPGLVDCDYFVENAYEMKVCGRYGWNFNKIVRFGQFYTSKFNNCFSEGKTDEPIGLSFGSEETKCLSTQQKISFKQFDSTGNSIKVKCFAESTTKITYSGNDMTGEEVVNDKYEIRFLQNDREYVLLYSRGVNAVSVLQFEDDTFNIVNSCRRDFTAKKAFNGFFIVSECEILAAVEMTNYGIVWIKNDLDAKIKLRLAAISTAILLKPDI
jgi:hypothetical protein